MCISVATMFGHAMVQVYQCIMSLPLGAGLTHPQGVLKPMDMPQLDCGSWHVRMPLASHNWPRSEEDLPRLLVDVLHGLASLHAQGIGHRNVRAPNILQVTPKLAVPMSTSYCSAALQSPCCAAESATERLTDLWSIPVHPALACIL